MKMTKRTRDINKAYDIFLGQFLEEMEVENSNFINVDVLKIVLIEFWDVT